MFFAKNLCDLFNEEQFGNFPILTITTLFNIEIATSSIGQEKIPKIFFFANCFLIYTSGQKNRSEVIKFKEVQSYII